MMHDVMMMQKKKSNLGKTPGHYTAYHDQDHIICNCYMMCLHGSDELWKSLLLFIYVLYFIYDLACSPMLVDAFAK